MEQTPDYSQEELKEEDEGFGLSADFVREVIRALDEGNNAPLAELVANLHAADLAELFNLLAPERRRRLIAFISPELNPEILPYLNPEVLGEVMEHLGAEKSAAAIATLDSDDALTIIEDMGEEERAEILQAIPEETREELQEGLAYPDDSAGRLMRKELVSVPEYWTVGDTIDHLRKTDGLPEDFYVIFVTDPKFRPTGTLMLSRIMQSKREIPVRDIMNRDVNPIPTDMDQEEVGHIFRKYGLVEAPVTNGQGRMVGTITVDDVVDVIQEEGEEDLMRLGGLSSPDFHAGLFDTVKRRFPWLFVNLATATIASRVIGHFEGTIEKLVTLAVLMPIVASIGGNAGTQAITVAVRAITTRQLRFTNAVANLRKEMLVGVTNGLALAALSACGLFLVYRDVRLSLVFALALVINLLMAGAAGALIPMTLSWLRRDPAISSGVFLTMLTDITGFFAFLGLASWMLF